MDAAYVAAVNALRALSEAAIRSARPGAHASGINNWTNPAALSPADRRLGRRDSARARAILLVGPGMRLARTPHIAGDAPAPTHPRHHVAGSSKNHAHDAHPTTEAGLLQVRLVPASAPWRQRSEGSSTPSRPVVGRRRSSGCGAGRLGAALVDGDLRFRAGAKPEPVPRRIGRRPPARGSRGGTRERRTRGKHGEPADDDPAQQS